MKKEELSVLIIEDNPVYNKKLEHWMNKLTKEIYCSHSAENGSYFVSSQKPDLILLDNQLPRLNGSDVISIYKEMVPNAKIILMSDAFDVNEVSDAIQRKADYVFNKQDITLEELKTIYQTCISEKTRKESFWGTLNIFNDRKNIPAKNSIAIVEDDGLFSFYLSWQLNNLTKNHNIISFSNGESFYNYLKESKPDIVFLDYNLPDTSGKDIMKVIGTKHPETKVIIISSQDDPKAAGHMVNLGIYGYIVKNKDWKTKLQEYIEELDI